MKDIILLLMGLFISILGIVNIKGNISSIHSYNRRRVKEEDVHKYGKVIGSGTLIIGVGLLLSSLLTFLKVAIQSDYITVPAIILGLIIIVYGQFKYNKGIF